MNIFLTCKLFNGDALYFLKPISNISKVENVYVFRDAKGFDCEKVKYILPFKSLRKLKFIFRFFQMLFYKRKNLRLIIGIYEIPHGLIAMIVGKLLRKPVVVCIIGNPAYTPLRKGFRKKLTYFILRNANYITTTGTNSRNFLIKEGFVEEKIHILPNTIDVEYFIPKQIPKKYDIITLGRISPEKQLLVFVEVINLLRKDFPAIKVGIGGRGPQKDEIVNRIKELNLQDNIEILGFIQEDNLVDFFNSGKIFLSCSETEGFPRTVIQSVSCGTPCVSSNVGDMNDLVIDEYSGFLVHNSKDENEYYDKIIKLLNNSELYVNFVKNGLNLVKNKYSYDAGSNTWMEITKKLKI